MVLDYFIINVTSALYHGINKYIYYLVHIYGA